MKIATRMIRPAQRTQIVRVELADKQAIQQLGQSRHAQEYLPSSLESHPFLLPPSVHRFLYDVEAMEDLQKRAQTYQIEDAHIKIIRQKLTYHTADGMYTCTAPLHVTRSFQYRGLRLAGPYFVSLLHNTVATLPKHYWDAPWAASLQEVRQPLSQQERQELIEYFMRIYLQESSSCTDITMISIPTKSAALRERSATHRAFTQLALPYPGSGNYVLPMGSSDMYLFAHSKNEQTRQQIQAMLADPSFLEKITTFGWSSHIFEQLQSISEAEMQLPAFVSLMDQQIFTVLEDIRRAWRDARTAETL